MCSEHQFRNTAQPLRFARLAHFLGAAAVDSLRPAGYPWNLAFLPSSKPRVIRFVRYCFESGIVGLLIGFRRGLRCRFICLLFMVFLPTTDSAGRLLSF
jgi:hypothetical protein